MNEKEKWNMVLDDTADIGKEPFPETTEKDKDFLERAKSLKEKYMKK